MNFFLKLLPTFLIVFSVQSQEDVRTNNIYFPNSGNWNGGDGKPYARIQEVWGARINPPDNRFVFSTASSFVVGYEPDGNGWGWGSLFVENSIGVGRTSLRSGCKLDVEGNIRSDEILVNIIHAPDYVFEEDHVLRTLKEVKKYIKINKHLPDIPPGREMEENGVGLADMNMRLLKKIEELTLYQIELLEEVEALEVRIAKTGN